MSNCKTKFAGLNFKNPVVASSATPTKNAEFMKKCVDAGLGGFVAKTTSWDKKEQLYPCPRFYVFYPDAVTSGKFYSFYTNELLAEYTPEEYVKEIEKVLPYAKENDCRVIASIMGGNQEEWKKMAELYSPVCEALELNLACPYGGELAGQKGSTLGADPELVKEVVKIVRSVTDKSLIAKLPAEAGDLTPVLLELDKIKVEAVHTTHRFSGLEIDIETGKPIMNGAISGYGGPWQGPISRKWVAKAAQITKLDICGGGGVDEWRDAIAHIMAGAKIVQMCGGPSLRGYKFFTETINKIKSFLDRKGYDSIEEIVGISVPFVRPIREVPRKDVFKPLAEIDSEKCIGCGICKGICFYEAITIQESVAVVDKAKCDGCGMCMQMCKVGAITLKDGEKVVSTSWEGARGRIGESSRK